jgi:light-regulated signal transduction histidine kinase (bacteriophytochrome)
MVTSFTKLLEEELHDALSDDGQRYIDFATEGALRMRTMIDDLLNYSRIGSHDNELVPTDLNDVMSRVLDNLAVAINESRADVRVSDLPTVTGIPSLLMRLLQNLISNAIKFVSDEDPCIQIDARHDEDHWTLTIQDNGIGIPLEHQDRVFQIFQRLHSRDEYDGTGIGLAVCRRIAERHGGKISLHSTTGQGTTFFVTLPDVDHVPPSSDTREELAPAPVS